MLHMTKTLSPPTSKTSRVSVPISPDVLVVFERFAKVGNMSTGRAIAEWLSDTVEAAEFMASTMEKARAAPKVAIREMQAYTLGLSDELSGVMDMVKAQGQKTRAERAAAEGARLREASAAAPGTLSPPSCNTGGKVPPTTPKPRGVKASRFPLPPAIYQAYADTNGVPQMGSKAPK